MLIIKLITKTKEINTMGAKKNTPNSWPNAMTPNPLKRNTIFFQQIDLSQKNLEKFVEKLFSTEEDDRRLDLSV